MQNEFIPARFICPVNQTIMQNPYIAQDSITYEKDIIESCLKINLISPMTGETIGTNIVFNRALKEEIDQYFNGGISDIEFSWLSKFICDRIICLKKACKKNEEFNGFRGIILSGASIPSNYNCEKILIDNVKVLKAIVENDFSSYPPCTPKEINYLLRLTDKQHEKINFRIQQTFKDIEAKLDGQSLVMARIY